ncbi:succinyldiaminopimelate transaminase [Quadrisphaera sp. DSM 44207]|uniref:succinyldiaminopimelate transaminase n=1 Tax=Quadrisphaera sp. DSM 44207 TaxID=1881057 RepID=UPI00088C8787|nr:succinyldiaminopimelate transaminase [Quadrisphaera sp. DSM 44207]SDQ71149.1 succinyldiaminopimelate aminotransferase apoenzyme [Quadrisphaera sp. DSM 44207]
MAAALSGTPDDQPSGGRWSALPDFPWDALVPAGERARAHPGGIVDLSVGTPVDPTPAVVQEALRRAADAPGYPAVVGTPALREAVAAWAARSRGVPDLDPAAVLPTVGSKELVAWLPTLLGLGPGDVVVHPAVAYPTYDVGARLAGATPLPVPAGELPDLRAGTGRVRLVWVNSPSNPTGEVLDAGRLREVVRWARSVGAVVASDECYAELAWDVDDVPSVLDPRVCEGGHEGLLLVSSLSKRSNLAGYRGGFVAGDPALVAALVAVRKHAGMIVPAPVQAAVAAALGDDAHVAEQRERYRRRREALLPALDAAGLSVPGSPAGLYLWATRGEDAWATVADLAERGVLVAPGSFYGPLGARWVRVALTASDERVRAGVTRLTPP